MPLAPDVHGYEEGVHYNYTPAGHALIISVKEPSLSEANAVQRGEAWFALVQREAALFILLKVGDLPWKMTHYNWWINAPVMRPDPWEDMDRLNGGIALGLCLVNALDGRIAALRRVRLSLELSVMFVQLVQAQMRPRFDPWRYLEVVEQTCTPSFNPEILLREALCMCVADLPKSPHLESDSCVTIQ